MTAALVLLAALVVGWIAEPVVSRALGALNRRMYR